MTRDSSRFEDQDSLLREYFADLAETEVPQGIPLPSAGVIWWRAQLEERRVLAKRSVQAIDAVLGGAILLLLGATIYWAPQAFSALPIPLPLTMACMLALAVTTSGVLAVWARQR